MMPRGSRFPVTGLDAVARVTVRTMRRLVGGRKPGLAEEGLRKEDAGSGERKVVEKTPEEIAISFVRSVFCFGSERVKRKKGVLRYPF